MKVNSSVTSSIQIYKSKKNKSDISFKGHLISLLPGKLKIFGQKFVENFNNSDIVKDFPFDTYIYKKGESLVMNTIIHTTNGQIKPIITKMSISTISLKDNHSLSTMLFLNHDTAKINMN